DVEQDADDAWPARLPDRAALVVVAEDEAVVLAVQGVAVGAVLADANAMPEAMAAHDPVDAGARIGGDRHQGQSDGQEDSQGCARVNHLSAQQIRLARVAACSRLKSSDQRGDSRWRRRRCRRRTTSSLRPESGWKPASGGRCG